jgi:hypothetical protein
MRKSKPNDGSKKLAINQVKHEKGQKCAGHANLKMDISELRILFKIEFSDNFSMQNVKKTTPNQWPILLDHYTLWKI